jgi:hypothetical protein
MNQTDKPSFLNPFGEPALNSGRVMHGFHQMVLPR